MSRFQLGQIVKHGHSVAAHYAVVVAEDRTIGWTNDSSLEVKPIQGIAWEAVALEGEAFPFDQIKANIRAFRNSLSLENAPRYHLTEFNCEHWATLMVTGRSYSTQSGAVKFGTAEIVGGAMILGGASAGTVVTIASLVGAAASTGTAISTLSGAAATNAAMAWLGGGAVAAGGGGMAAGSAILAAVSTGGAVIAIAGVGVITKKVWDNLDEAQRQEIIEKVDRATPEQVKVLANTTSEAVQSFVAETSQWIGDQSSQLAQAVRQAMPPELKQQIKGWLGNRQEVWDATGDMAKKIFKSIKFPPMSS
ncbi:hypothetical protein [Synechococcus elongatus]|uniref:LRAT domain-containing protein n=1 Tax=Synechococcus elongatus PCC 11802 TaxID=2283154 RepID=A0AAU6R6Q6_SYNEL|nr:hypothetical protein [Synechococcus elongatus]QFZ93020.1 hypothetical protein EKO22_12500 [Synechococcus elongatus PCC 11802]